jgi:hypothetical protein
MGVPTANTSRGGRRAALQGAGFSALGGVLYMIAALPGISSGVSLGVVVPGRLAAGLGESQFVTGCVLWSDILENLFVL